MTRSKSFIVFLCLIILVSIILLTSCKRTMSLAPDNLSVGLSEPTIVENTDSSEIGSNVLDNLEFHIPTEMKCHRASVSEESIQIDGTTVGGVFILECDEAIFDDVLNYTDSLTPLVLQAMQDVVISDITWHMRESSRYGLLEYTLGNEESEYIAYVVRGYSACYIFWFDRHQVSYELEIEIMQSIHSEDIDKDLNKISSEDYMTALGGKIDNGEYRFAVTLPEHISQKPATDGTLFYKDGQVIGGYKVVHFEKGILPAVQDNKDLIVSRLKEYMMDQIDLSDFNGEIADEVLITAVFTNGSDEYSHFIHSYGQVGTQYVIWLDTANLDQTTINSIVWGAQIIKN